MDKEFVPYNIALELRQLGFNEPCFAIYYSKDKSFSWHHHIDHTNDELVLDSGEFNMSAPTYSQAFRWFREKYGVFSWLTKHRFNTTTSLGNKEYYRWALEHEVVTSEPHINSEIIYSAKEFNTYEEAELACLIKLIEIVKGGNK